MIVGTYILLLQFQQARIEKFCHRNRMPNTLPQDISKLNATLRHLLYDDSRQLIFCYVPKNGCSNIKWMLLILNGTIPSSAVHKRPPESVLSTVSIIFLSAIIHYTLNLMYCKK